MSNPQLVEEIKTLQKSDPNGKQAWWGYCDAQLGGIRDPSKHQASVLQNFLRMYKSGSMAQMAPSPWMQMAMGGMGGGMGGQISTADFVKTGQRKSEDFKTAWQAYCAIYGNGRNDPSKKDEDFIAGFMDYLGELAADGLAVIAQQQGVDLSSSGVSVGSKRSRGIVDDGPAAKRHRPGNDMDATKRDLCTRLKALQKSNADAKEAWQQFCDSSAGGVKDPARHETASLQTFLATWA